jgi:SPP1 gp7 family putative phage head morphogenesis protein
VHPNAGIRAAYRRRLLIQVNDMIDSYKYWLKAGYRAHPPVLAQDETPSQALKRELGKLGRRWRKRFDEMADGLADYFARSTKARSDAALRKILKDAGWTVQMPKMTRAMRDVMAATITENVGLIRSIPQQFHTQIEGMVMRSFAVGGDLATLTRDLQRQFGSTRKRAELIARDQNNKATSAFLRVRYLDMGITEAVWMHSGGGKEPRPTHVRNNGKRYNVETGWLDPAVGEYIHPGTLINCRCTSRPVVRGFT